MQCSFIASTLMWDGKDGPNPLVAAAEKISIDGGSEMDDVDQTGKGALVSENGPGRMPSQPVNTIAVNEAGEMESVQVGEDSGEGVLPEGAPEPPKGSLEAMMRMFGGVPPPQ